MKKISAIVILIAAGIIAFYFFKIGSRNEPDFSKGRVGVIAKNGKISAEVAMAPETREKGLSGRDSLCLDCGMLFVFDKKDKYTFWMKEMRFNLDMVWIDGARIVQIDENIPYYDGEAEIRHSNELADKVLEINAGAGEKLGLRVGDSVAFE